MDLSFKQAMLNSNWASSCRRVEFHLERMSANWDREVFEIVANKTRQFISLPAPRSDAESHNRFSMGMGLTSMIACVSHIESMLGGYPRHLADRLELAKAICSLKLPTTRAEDGELHSARMAISTQVSSISFDELAVARRR